MTQREIISAVSGFVAGSVLCTLLSHLNTRYHLVSCPFTHFFHQRIEKGQRVAVLLSGSGVYDGSEITEAISLLIHLAHQNAQVTVFAPNKRQYDTIDHTSGKDMTGGSRNVMVEAARISRGQIQNLSVLNVDEFDALFIPGGFGIAKTLSTYASNGMNYSVDSEVHKVLVAFTQAKKPIGLCCIAPVLIAKVITGVKLTIGSTKKDDKWPYAEETTKNLTAAGAVVMEKNYNEICIDQDNLVVTAPAYMYNGTPEDVYNNVGQMVQATMKLAAKSKSQSHK